MSSAIYLKFDTPIQLTDWMSFCATSGIEHNPRVVGQNVFYKYGDTSYRDDVEIHFGNPIPDAPRLQSGSLDLARVSPEPEAKEVTVSTYWMGNLDGVADVAKRILSIWPTHNIECAPELESLM